MNRPRIDSIVAAWAVCAALVAAGLLVLAALAAGPTPFEEEVVAELATLQDAPASSTRVVVIGTSMMASATQHSPTLEDALLDANQNVRIANIAAPARWFNSYEPLLDHVFEADPDVIIVQTGVFAQPGTRPDNSLSERVRLLLGQRAQPVRYLAPSCVERYSSDVDVIAEELAPLFERDGGWVDEAEQFAQEAASRDIHVYMVSVPRSELLVQSIGSAVTEFDERVFDELSDEPNVTIAPLIDIPDGSFYCDFNHLNAAGQQQFLASLVPSLSNFLETIGGAS